MEQPTATISDTGIHFTAAAADAAQVCREMKNPNSKHFKKPFSKPLLVVDVHQNLSCEALTFKINISPFLVKADGNLPVELV